MWISNELHFEVIFIDYNICVAGSLFYTNNLELNDLSLYSDEWQEMWKQHVLWLIYLLRVLFLICQIFFLCRCSPDSLSRLPKNSPDRYDIIRITIPSVIMVLWHSLVANFSEGSEFIWWRFFSSFSFSIWSERDTSKMVTLSRLLKIV